MTHSWPHSSHVDDHSHGTTTQLPVTLGWASTSHGTFLNINAISLYYRSICLFLPPRHSWPHSSHVDDPSHGTTTQLRVTLGWASTSHGEGTSHGDSVFQAPLHSYIQSCELNRFSSIGSKKAAAEVPASS
ncbi:uncharacterized protein LOC142506068 isoform X3 [Primulina tabacum]|uniref:uncharacterized protein LOC142506068 isoform X3 n=1 Tax=Primulina tabacum TaxID=48773 RepID=UPI003F594D59